MNHCIGSILACALLSFMSAPAQDHADKIYFNGKIITMWDAHPVAQAVAIKGNRFLLVGTNAEVLRSAGPSTSRVDLKGRTVTPGIVESHVHPVSAAASEYERPI